DGIRDRNVTGVQTCALPITRVLRALLLWKVDNTKCPDRLVFISSEAISLSLISPNIIMSGSHLNNPRTKGEYFKLAFSLISTWTKPSTSYSTGSSMLMIDL